MAGFLSKLFASPVKAAEQEARIAELKLKASVCDERRKVLERAYDAAQPSQYWQRRGDNRSGNSSMDQANTTLRSWARYLDENHDLAVGVLDDLVKKVIGCGIQLEPMVKTAKGSLDKKANKALRDLWAEWTLATPDSTRTMAWPEIEAKICRTWLRDGEVLVQHLEGLNRGIRHRSRVPYSLELIEADYLPFDLAQESTTSQNRIIHGVELTDWREPIAFWLYREHPGDMGMMNTLNVSILRDFKRVSADVISHIKFTRRLGQVRGVPVFHAVLRRFEDIKDYEESERVAARVAAAMCAVIQKNADFQGGTNLTDAGNRAFEFNPGMVFDNLLPGETVQMLDNNRPNTNLENFRNGQLRAIASGTGTSYSGVSRNYNGTYSAQRQELVESWVGYEGLREILYGQFYRPIWQRFVRMAVAAGLVRTSGVDMNSLFAVDLVGPAMPWIDPVKEVEAATAAVTAGFKSRQMVIRENQYDPAIVDEQIKADGPMRELLTPKPAATATPKATEADANADPQPEAADAA